MNKTNVYTPQKIVWDMLELMDYRAFMTGNSNIVTDNIIRKYIIDPACGDGNILYEIVDRYITACLYLDYEPNAIEEHLAKYIYGYDIDQDAIDKCIIRLNKLLSDYDLNPIEWNIKCCDSLELKFRHNQILKFDYVITNPPYQRLRDWNKTLQISSSHIASMCIAGNTDLYLLFFELGIDILNENGKLCYLTPNTWLTSDAAKKLRERIIDNKLLSKVILHTDQKIFKENVQTMVVVLDKNNPNTDQSFYIDGKFYFNYDDKFKAIMEWNFNDFNRYGSIVVKNGVQTGLNKLYFNDNYNIEDEYILRAYNINKKQWTKCFYPYQYSKWSEFNGETIVLDLQDIKQKNPKIYDLLITNHDILVNRSLINDKKWWAFARSQGLLDVYKSKICINNLIKDYDSLEIEVVESGTVVYNGIYILTVEEDEWINNKKIIEILDRQDFVDYVKMLNKPRQGGYYTFNGKELQKYIEYHYQNEVFNNYKNFKGFKSR